MKTSTNEIKKLGIGFIRAAELAKLLSVSKGTVYRWVKVGIFPKPVKLGPQVTAWKAQDVQAWMDKQGGAA